METSPNRPFTRDSLTWLCYFMLGYFACLEAIFGPIMPFLRSELDMEYTVGALHPSAFALGMMIAGVTADSAAKRLGRSLVFWGGSAGLAGGTIFLSMGTIAALTIASAFVMGLLGAYLFIMIQSVLSDHHGENRVSAFTEANVIASLTAGIGALLVGGFEGIGLGWRGALFTMIIFWGAMVVIYRQIPIPSIKQNVLPSHETNTSPTAPIRAPLPFLFWIYWGALILGVSIEWCITVWSADYLVTQAELSRSLASTLTSVYFLAMVIGRSVGSILTRRFPPSTLLFATMVVTAIGFPIFWLSTVGVFSVIGLFIAGIGVSNFFPLILSMATNTAPHQADTVSARISLGAGMAILLAPLILGTIADQITIQGAYGIVGVLLVSLLGISLYANRITSEKVISAG